MQSGVAYSIVSLMETNTEKDAAERTGVGNLGWDPCLSTS